MSVPTARIRAIEHGRATWGASWLPEVGSRAPGRLELLGNHVDYNGGTVLAAAIDRDVDCALASDTSGTIEVAFADVDGSAQSLSIDELNDWRNPGGSPRPLDYVRGVIATGLS